MVHDPEDRNALRGCGTLVTVKDRTDESSVASAPHRRTAPGQECLFGFNLVDSHDSGFGMEVALSEPTSNHRALYH